jgi:hypothetical protein
MAHQGGPAERKGREIAAPFSMIGAIPNSAWLEGCIMFDELYQNGIGSFSRRLKRAPISIGSIHNRQ